MKYSSDLGRRNFIKKTAIAAGGFTLLTSGLSLGVAPSSIPTATASASSYRSCSSIIDDGEYLHVGSFPGTDKCWHRGLCIAGGVFNDVTLGERYCPEYDSNPDGYLECHGLDVLQNNQSITCLAGGGWV